MDSRNNRQFGECIWEWSFPEHKSSKLTCLKVLELQGSSQKNSEILTKWYTFLDIFYEDSIKNK